jgi:ABC-type ATPase with predicted acetyltransferase domain
MARAAQEAARVASLCVPGAVVLVSGPSGSGKSTLLRAVARRLRRRGMRGAAVVRARPVSSPRWVACLGAGDLESHLGRLARVGLAEAGVILGRAGEVSDGQADRLALAMAVERAEAAAGRGAHAVVIADEFTSRLDRLSARGVCSAVRGAADAGGGLAIVLATAHDDVKAMLRPDVHVHLSITGSPRYTLARRRARAGERRGRCG